eukprot:10002786-Lingulodinium_polyedra.AAC.1
MPLPALEGVAQATPEPVPSQGLADEPETPVLAGPQAMPAAEEALVAEEPPTPYPGPPAGVGQ